MTSPQDRGPAGRPADGGRTPDTGGLRVDGPEASSPLRTAAPRPDADATAALPRADAAREPGAPADRPAGETPRAAREDATNVLPSGSVLPGAATGGVRRPARPAASSSRPSRPAEAPRPAGKGRRARLALQRIDPWSVFTYTLLASLFLGLALVVAVFALYTVLGSLGVTDTVNELYLEVNPGGTPLFSSGRFVGGAAVLAAVNVVLLTLLATLGALLYNLIASFTGGIEVTLGDRDA